MSTINRRGLIVVLAAVMSMAVVFAPCISSDSSEAAGPGEYYRYTITTDLDVTDANGTDMTPISRVSDWNFDAGSWDYDNDGYGPFNSYYAAINPITGRVLCHLDPYDLTQSIDGRTTVDGVAISACNIMWVLPTVYMGLDGTSLVMCSEQFNGSQAYAHTIDGKVYRYLAIGVYEAHLDTTNRILMSKSGVTPTPSTTLTNYRDYANNNTVDGGHAMVWNFYQWNLYRICSLAVMGSFNSQEVVGYGYSNGGSLSYVGSTGTMGPYTGSGAASSAQSKLFIDNSWGHLAEYVDDTYYNLYKFYVGSNSVPSDGANRKTEMGELGYYLASTTFGGGCSTLLQTWGMPTTGATPPEGTCDGASCTSGYLMVGYHWGGGTYAGVNAYQTYDGRGYKYVGTRISMVFDSDPLNTCEVTYDHSNLIDLGSSIGDPKDITKDMPTGTVILEPGSTRYDQLGPVSSEVPGIGDITYTHTGWTYDGTVYSPTAVIPVNSDHTAVSVWTRTQVVIFDNSAVSDLGGSPSALTYGLPIRDGTIYPDYGTVFGLEHIGWYIDGQFLDPGSPVVHATDHVAYSAWEVPLVTMTLSVDGGVYSTIDVPKGSVGIVCTPENVSGIFMGWYYDTVYTQKYDATQPLDSDVTLYAKGVMPLKFTSSPVADATITNIDASGLFYFDATDSESCYEVFWDFGDGSTSTDPITYNQYSQSGNYTVTLTVTNSLGESDSRTYGITIGDTDDDGSDGIAPIAMVVVMLIVAMVLWRWVL